MAASKLRLLAGLSCLILALFLASAKAHTVRRFTFVLKTMNITRLCNTQEVTTVNGMFPGPTLKVRDGDTIIVKVVNRGRYNATIHWHGIFQRRTGWADGPEYVTQCPIQPGNSYTYKFNISGQAGTLWWHGHSSWLRATVYGALIIYPKIGVSFPYRPPRREQVIMLGEWWKANPLEVIQQALQVGANPIVSDTLTINGQPGDLLPCSSSGTTRIEVQKGETILLRIINSAMNEQMFVKLADHVFTVVAADARYTKPLRTEYLMIGPGQTTDVLVTASKSCGSYYMAARAAVTSTGIDWDRNTTTAIFRYSCDAGDAKPHLPALPAFNATALGERFSAAIRGFPALGAVPRQPDVELFYTVGFGLFRCAANATCQGPVGQRLTTSMNNYSLVMPTTTSILQAHYYNISGVYTTDFPDSPPVAFNYSQPVPPTTTNGLLFAQPATKARVVRFNQTVQIVFQGTGFLGGEAHPMHLHGYDFYVVGTGKGNYDSNEDPKKFNLFDPPMRNTVNVPVNGWTVIRFVADNPGVWLLHCHLDLHVSMGLAMVLIVEGGPEIEPPPPDFPKC